MLCVSVPRLALPSWPSYIYLYLSSPFPSVLGGVNQEGNQAQSSAVQGSQAPSRAVGSRLGFGSLCQGPDGGWIACDTTLDCMRHNAPTKVQPVYSTISAISCAVCASNFSGFLHTHDAWRHLHGRAYIGASCARQHATPYTRRRYQTQARGRGIPGSSGGRHGDGLHVVRAAIALGILHRPRRKVVRHDAAKDDMTSQRTSVS